VNEFLSVREFPLHDHPAILRQDTELALPLSWIHTDRKHAAPPFSMGRVASLKGTALMLSVSDIALRVRDLQPPCIAALDHAAARALALEVRNTQDAERPILFQAFLELLVELVSQVRRKVRREYLATLTETRSRKVAA
jgi:hypothetical protein